MGNLDGKIAIVTGGAQGIGKASAVAFAREGARGIVIADMNLPKSEAAGKEIAEAYGCECIAVKCNIVDENDIKNLIDVTLAKFGTIDILVNSAGICPLATIEDVGSSEWDIVMDIDLKGAYLVTRAAFLVMKEKGSGKIVNLSSMAGRQGGITSGVHYSTAKGAIITMTKQFAKAGAAFNINVNGVAPGLIATDMTAAFGYKNEQVPLGRLGTAEDVANAIEFLVSERSSYITGCTIDVNGGMLMT